MRKWITPGGTAHNVLLDMLAQPHLLIAGSTGSGKSVLINSLIYTALLQSPATMRLVLIDPKLTELDRYKRLPHCIKYADTLPDIAAALAYCAGIMAERNRRMKQQEQTQSTEPHIYIIVDEFADLVTKAQKSAIGNIIELARLGRAANIHLVLATQSPSRQVITAAIKANMTSRVALRCEERIESRQIINRPGAEDLPNYGYGLYRTPKQREPALVQIPMTQPSAISERIDWWRKQRWWFLW